MNIIRQSAGVAVLCAALSGSVALAQEVTHLVVPFGPGSVTDNLARVVAPAISAELGETIIVDNRPGGSTVIGANYVANAEPDGNTLLLSGMALAVNPSVLTDPIPYDAIEDFVPISLVATSQVALVVNAGLGLDTVEEVVEWLRERPGEVAYASAGAGNMTHFGMEVFRHRNGLDIIHVPYGSGAEAVNDVAAGHVPMMMVAPSTALPHLDAGNVKLLAVTTTTRSAVTPDVPTFAEIGMPLPEVDGGSWFGILAPAGTDQAEVERIAEATRTALANPDLVAQLEAMGYAVVGSTPEEFDAFLRDQIEMWPAFIEEAGITLE